MPRLRANLATVGPLAAVLGGLPTVAFVIVAVEGPWGSDQSWLVVGLAIVGAVLQAFPVPLRPDVKTSLSTIPVLLAILIGGMPAALAVALGSSSVVIWRIPRGARFVKGPYNVAMFVLPTAAASSLFQLVSGDPRGPVEDLTLGLWIPGILVALLAYYVVNNVMLALALWVTGGPSPTETLPGLFVAWWAQVLQIGFALIAFVVFVAAELPGLVLLLIPLVSARRALAGMEAQRVSLDRAVRALVRLVEVKDEYTRGHAERVADLSDRVAKRLGLSPDERYWIRIGAVLHDVGKIGVPLEVLNKPGGFTEEEFWQMRRHPDLGADLIEKVDALAPAVPLVRQHHERIDGCGYPRGMSGEDVPFSTRIVSAVDSWDAMTTTRPYRDGLPAEVAVSELRAHTGTQFDARVVEALIAEVAPELAEVVPLQPEPARVDRSASAEVPR